MQVKKDHFRVGLLHTSLQRLKCPRGQTAHLKLIWKLSSIPLRWGESTVFTATKLPLLLLNYYWYCSFLKYFWDNFSFSYGLKQKVSTSSFLGNLNNSTYTFMFYSIHQGKTQVSCFRMFFCPYRIITKKFHLMEVLFPKLNLKRLNFDFQKGTGLKAWPSPV